MHQGLLQRPIESTACPDFPIIKYADDTLIILKAKETQLHVLQEILQQFHASTGLKVNFQKSNLIPLNMTTERGHHFADLLTCKIGTLPFTYLGLPLGTAKPKIEEFMPMIKRIESRLTCFSSMLSYGGKLQLVNSVFSTLPTFQMSTFMLPKGVIAQIDKYKRHCLWRGHDLTKKNPPLCCLGNGL